MIPPGSRPQRLVFLGDVGGADRWHVGDEAMLEANLALFGALAPGAVPVVASGDPAATAARLGVAAVPRLRFDPPSSTRAEACAAIDAMVEAAAAGRAAPPAMQALAAADALVISGGGNLCSTWPEHILERLAMVRLARALGRPVLILGQTLGPWLSAADRPLLAELLDAARWVGVREAASYALAQALGVKPERLHLQDDDAASLMPDSGPPVAGRPVVLVTLHAFTDPSGIDPRLDALAAALRAVAEETDAELVFLPHAAPGRDGEPGDRDMAAALARRIGLRVLPLPDVAAAVQAASGAALVISSRYHPIVFGLAACRPCLGLPVDEYTRVKLHGALAAMGQEDALLPLDPAGIAGLAAQALTLWRRRDAIGAELAKARAAWRQRDAARRQGLARALAGAPPAPAEDGAWVMRQLGLALAARGEEIARIAARDGDALRAMDRARRESEAYALDLRAHLDRCQADSAASHAASERLLKEITRLRATTLGRPR